MSSMTYKYKKRKTDHHVIGMTDSIRFLGLIIAKVVAL